MDLFSANEEKAKPLADRMRPSSLDDFLGQEHIVGKGTLLRRAIEADRLTSSIFFGPPGVGKTTLASIIAGTTSSAFVKLNAVTSGVGEVREVIAKAKELIRLHGKSSYLLLDECHRWSKAQSDSILPAIESGSIRFIGSTTENPVIAMTPAIVSRCRLFEFRSLTVQDVKKGVLRALHDKERGFGLYDVELQEAALEHIASIANGDVRNALNALELAVLTTTPGKDGKIVIDEEVAAQSIQQKVLAMDESYFYDMLSAFCKSLRGSDSDAALAWFARMVQSGVDPRIIVRRVVVHASEDVGLANPQAMLTAAAAWQALESIGMPEARIPITQAILMVCESPKSNSVVMAMDAAFSAAQRAENAPVPTHLRDTHYKGATKKLGRGEGYLYPHDFPGHWVEQQYMPQDALGEQYYFPSEMGFEQRIRLSREARGGKKGPKED
ncbi:MAG: replication-associated recombination protein A [Christensenellaceae bacterium]|jgi:putative ATPase|nr:replication-associated recombination protein A [Christensenellaceae bacterium]